MAAVTPHFMPLEKRMEGNSGDDRIKITDLTSGLFQHRPRFDDPDNPTIMRLFPTMRLFNGFPFFFTDEDSRLSKAELLRAYDHLTLSHTADPERGQFLSMDHRENRASARVYDTGLDMFAI